MSNFIKATALITIICCLVTGGVFYMTTQYPNDDLLLRTLYYCIGATIFSLLTMAAGVIKDMFKDN